MSIGQTLDRLTCSAGRKEGRSIKGNFDGAAVAWSSSQSSLIIAFFPPTPLSPAGCREMREAKVVDKIVRLRRERALAHPMKVSHI